MFGSVLIASRISRVAKTVFLTGAWLRAVTQSPKPEKSLYVHSCCKMGRAEKKVYG